MLSQNKNILAFRFFNLKNKELFIYSLIIIMVGIFLLPRVAYFSTITEENIIMATNAERAERGVDPLTANQLLAQSAYLKAQALFDNQVFSHGINGNTFSHWIKQTGYKYTFVGENLAIDFITSEGAVKAWMASPTHRKNLLNNQFKEIGIAVMEGTMNGEKTILVVQEFGTPLAVKTDTYATKLNVSELYLESDGLPEASPLSLIGYLNTSTSRSSLLASDLKNKPVSVLGLGEHNITNSAILDRDDSQKQDSSYFGVLSGGSIWSSLNSWEGFSLIKEYIQNEFPSSSSLFTGLALAMLITSMLIFSLIQFYKKILTNV